MLLTLLEQIFECYNLAMRPVTFLRTLYNTLSNPSYYINVLNVRFWFSVRFVLVGYVLLTLLAAALFTIHDVPILERSLTTFVDQEIERFPAEENITWNGLRLTSTLAETYTLPLPELPDLVGKPPLLLQLNPNVKSVEDISSLSISPSLFFVGELELYVSQLGGQWSPMPLSDVLTTQSGELNKAQLIEGKAQYLEFVRTSVRMLPLLFPLFYFFISLPLRFFNILLDTAIIFFATKMLGYPLPFRKNLQISLHVGIVAELVTVLTAQFATGLPMFTLTFWAYTILIYWKLRHVQMMPIDVLVDREKDSD